MEIIMRKHYIIGAALGLLALVSCNQKMEFNNVAFAAFDQKSVSVKEDAGTAKVDLTTYGITAQTPVTLSFGGTAKLGEDYTVSGAEGGIVTFSEAGTKSLTLNIVDHPGVYTGNLTITIKIDSVPEGVEIGALKNLTVTIIDNDHPLSAFFGTWTGSTESSWDATPYSLSITIAVDASDNTNTKLIITGLHPFFVGYGYNATYSGTVNKEKTTISIASGQAVGYSSYILRGYGSPTATNSPVADAITMELQADGTLLIPNAWGDNAIYETYAGNVTLKK